MAKACLCHNKDVRKQILRIIGFGAIGLMFTGCPAALNTGQSSVSAEVEMGNAVTKHGELVTETTIPSEASIVEKPSGWPDSGYAHAELPADRCRAGKITFGPVDGKYVSCPALGRGVARWGWEAPPAKHNTRCMNSPLRTVASDWQQGENSSGQKCFFLKAEKRCGATPSGGFRVSGGHAKKTSWGGYGAMIFPKFKTKGVKRSSFLVHSDNRFSASQSKIDDRAHSTAGCVKLSPGCQSIFNRFASQNKGAHLEVQ